VASVRARHGESSTGLAFDAANPATTGKMPVGPTDKMSMLHRRLILVWINDIAPGHRYTERTQRV
jgi:hypothetical protein